MSLCSIDCWWFDKFCSPLITSLAVKLLLIALITSIHYVRDYWITCFWIHYHLTVLHPWVLFEKFLCLICWLIGVIKGDPSAVLLYCGSLFLCYTVNILAEGKLRLLHVMTSEYLQLYCYYYYFINFFLLYVTQFGLKLYFQFLYFWKSLSQNLKR